MTVIKIGNKNNTNAMEFAFDYEMDAFNFYTEVKDHYREDDLIIVMEEEKDDVQNA